MKSRSPFLLLLLLPSISFLMGTCSEEDEHTNEEKAGSGEEILQELEGKTWRVLRMKDSSSSDSRSPEADYLLRITSDSSFSLSLKVNDCQGYFRIPEKGLIGFEEMTCTEMCCDPPFAKDLTDRISNVERYSFRGQELTLEAPDGSLILKLLERNELEGREEE